MAWRHLHWMDRKPSMIRIHDNRGVNAGNSEQDDLYTVGAQRQAIIYAINGQMGFAGGGAGDEAMHDWSLRTGGPADHYFWRERRNAAQTEQERRYYRDTFIIMRPGDILHLLFSATPSTVAVTFDTVILGYEFDALEA